MMVQLFDIPFFPMLTSVAFPQGDFFLTSVRLHCCGRNGIDDTCNFGIEMMYKVIDREPGESNQSQCR